MSQIPVQIGRQAFELIRDRIGQILADEIVNQVSQGWINDVYWTSESQVWLERFVPLDKTELPAVVVGLTRGDMEWHTQQQSNGNYRFNIDCYSSAKSTEDSEGDSEAMIRLHRLMGVVRAILENPRYKTLGFEPPFIQNRHMESFGIGNPAKEDALSTTFARWSFVVRVHEETELISPPMIKGYDTTINLDLTNKGYFWRANNY